MGLLGGRSIQSWISEYEGGHRHPVNRACHAFGIPAIIVALILLACAPLAPPLWTWGAALFLVGWSLQFIGHAFEGRPPEFFKDWRFLLVGTRWWWATVRGRLRNR